MSCAKKSCCKRGKRGCKGSTGPVGPTGVPNFFQAEFAVGDTPQNVTGAPSNVQINFPTVSFPDTSIFTYAAGLLTAVQAGTYELSFTIIGENTANAATITEFSVVAEHNGTDLNESAYATTTAVSAFVAGFARVTHSVSGVLITLAVGDTLNVDVFSGASGGAIEVWNGSHLSVIKVA